MAEITRRRTGELLRKIFQLHWDLEEEMQVMKQGPRKGKRLT